MRTLTIALGYFNQMDALRKHITAWNRYPEELKKKLSFIIVDDYSSIPAARVLETESNLHGLDIHLYRVKTDLFWNVAGARNLGLQETETEWALLLDMDTMVDTVTLRQLFELIQGGSQAVVYQFNRRISRRSGDFQEKPHPGVMLIRKDDYWSVGGSDEDFAGAYGYNDRSFLHRAGKQLEIRTCRDIYLHHESSGVARVVKGRSRNEKLFKAKRKNNSWSTDYLRFDWEEVAFTSNASPLNKKFDKVICVGLPKTGTTTLRVCLQLLGYSKAPYDLELIHDVANGNMEGITSILQSHTCFEDWPWPIAYEAAYELEPRAAYVLTERASTRVWLESLRKHTKREPSESSRELRESIFGHDDPWRRGELYEEYYEDHIASVRGFFEDKKDQFLQVCWERGDGWKQLCDFLGLDEPVATPFPHANSAKEKERLDRVRERRKNRGAWSRLLARLIPRV